jgi:hypothetical protein
MVIIRKINFILCILSFTACGNRAVNETKATSQSADSTIISEEDICLSKSLHNALYISNESVFNLSYSIWGKKDTLTRPTWDELQIEPTPNLRDTVKTKLVFDNYDKEFTDEIAPNGNHCITFRYFRGDYIQGINYIFPQKVYRKIDNKTNFEIDWYRAFSREDQTLETTSVFYSIYNKGDTIISYTEPESAGGTTPEGHTFRFSGEQIDSIKVKSKAIFSVSQGFDLNGIDDWAVWLYNLESEWIDTSNDRYSYTMPTLDNVSISKDNFSKIRNKAISVQKDVLINKRNAIGDVSGVLKNFKPKFEDAKTANDLYLAIELSNFVNNITVFYKGGSTKEFVHIADYLISVP